MSDDDVRFEFVVPSGPHERFESIAEQVGNTVDLRVGKELRSAIIESAECVDGVLKIGLRVVVPLDLAEILLRFSS